MNTHTSLSVPGSTVCTSCDAPPDPAPDPAPDPTQTSEPDPAPCVGVIYNPRSHRNKGRDLVSDPPPHVHIAKPGDHLHLQHALEQFAGRGIDLLVINGGDGTVRDVLTCGYEAFGANWPALAVLPKGKTNALTVDLEAPREWSLQGAIDAYRAGRRIRRRPIIVRRADHASNDHTEKGHTNGQAPLLGFIMGAGAFTLAIRAGQDAHRLGAFNGLAVGVTTVWTALQFLLGTRGNKWRKGAKMDIRLGDSRAPLIHSGYGDPRSRQLLFASTLERFPSWIKPFGRLTSGLKLAVLDQTSRLQLCRLPAIISGKNPSNMSHKGFHRVAAEHFEIALDQEFILDGEAYEAGHYRVEPGPELEFVSP